MEISGTTVLITGASGGLGGAIAAALRAAGAELVLSGRNVESLESLAAATGGRTLAADLSDRDDLLRLAEEAGAIDVLVANAGVPGSGPALEYTYDQIDRAIDVNLRAPMVLARALAPGMVERRRGHIVFISSLSGKSAQAGSAVYSATKFGLAGFSQGLRQDLAAAGVGVTAVFPGFVREAGMFARSQAELPVGIGTSSPEDVAAGVLDGIRRNRGEVVVAPVAMRLGTKFAALAPDLAARVATRAGGSRVAAEISEGQRHLR